MMQHRADPPCRPPDPDRDGGFLCDAMLGRLARWLRAAGHDTLLAEGTETDRDLLARARAERRILLTRDRRFTQRQGAAGHVVLIEGGKIADQARDLKRRLGLDWLRAPFSRCMMDNARLRPATAAETAGRPDWVGAEGGGTRVLACPACGRSYWAGSHRRRMRQRLEAWNRDMPRSAPPQDQTGDVKG